MRIVSIQQMVRLEKEANQRGLSFEKMMANAGEGLGKIVHDRFFQSPGQKVLGMVGGGNNGGDTLIALSYLSGAGWLAEAYLVKDRERDDPLVGKFLETGGEIARADGDRNFSKLKEKTRSADVILDGIMGTGITLPLQGTVPQILKIVGETRQDAVVVAVDCPSGVDCDSGQAAPECLKADLTVCMAAVKAGLLKFPAAEYTGILDVVDIGLPRSLAGWKSTAGEVLSKPFVSALIPERKKDSHKGTFGTCMVVAGSVNYCGAALLAARAAYRVGAGLVNVAVPGAIYETIAGHLPEATWIILPDTDGLINRDGAKLVARSVEKATALLLGPGFGLDDETREFLGNLLELSRTEKTAKKSIGFVTESSRSSSTRVFPPVVVDADGLKLISKIQDWHKKLPSPAVLAPHPGEMAIMTGLAIDEIQKNRISVALEHAKKWGHVVVLKGALTVVADPGGEYAVNPVATSALATAGTGDVLSGMIAGLIAQGLDSFSAACAGVWLHGQAGLIASGKFGGTVSVIAGDVIEAIPSALKTTTGTRN